MNYFEEQDGKLIFRGNGETVLVEPWGADSIRVRSCMLGEIKDKNAALLPVENKADEISINIDGDGMKAMLHNGKIRARMEVRPIRVLG